ncbi:MAG: cysteine synthase A [Gemmatimonadota bacterium]|nr:MAG: cysteine synthase A [Gemmatimonadota bacterium]
MTGKGDALVWAKLESFNPGGSVKDRIALNMISEAEKNGLLTPETTIVEPTSGNTGIGLALVAACKGYNLILTMPETMSIERRKLLKAYGAEIVLTPGAEGMSGAVKKAQEIASQSKNVFMPQQFQNPANPDIHRKTTAREILDQVGNNIHAFIAGVGTGGTVTGVGEVLKKEIEDIQIVAVEPADSPVLSGGKPGSHKIQGIGAGFIPDILNRDILDRVIQVTNEDAATTARKLAEEEGLLAGISSGANVWAAQRVAQELGRGHTVVVIVCDTGERYLSTDLFQG